MWVWIPNEQQISFRWVFQHAVPKLIPKWLRNRVRFIMKDGDPQQRNEIIQSLLSIFVNAIEGGCGWHIGKSFHPISHLINLDISTWLTSYSFFMVHQGMKDHVPGEMTFMKSNRARWRDVIHRVKLWVYSWMRPGYVETEEEYKISKFLLLQFVCSPSFLSAAEGKMFVVISMLRFLQKHVFVYEHLYCHYLRRSVRHFDTSHATAHEVRSFFWLCTIIMKKFICRCWMHNVLPPREQTLDKRTTQHQWNQQWIWMLQHRH